MYEIKVTRYYPTLLQRIKIFLFGYEILEQCRSEEVQFDDSLDEGWFLTDIHDHHDPEYGINWMLIQGVVDDLERRRRDENA